MLTNPDGSRYCLCSALEIIEQRFEKEEWPYLSDVLGSDWTASFPHPSTSDGFRELARMVAARHYRD